MKRIFKEVLCIVGIISMLCGLLACKNIVPGDSGKNGAGKKAKDNESGVTYFYYSYNGSIGGDSYSIELKQTEENECQLSYDSLRYAGRITEPMTKLVDKAVLGEIDALYKELRLAEWDGFNKVNTSILDGSGFSLTIGFADGERLNAYGSNSVPERYMEFCDKMDAICDPLIEDVCNDFRQSVIAKGITGKLDFVMANFIQRGSSGSDVHKIMLSKSGVNGNNFDVEIKASGRDAAILGEYKVLGAVPEEFIDFEAIQALIEKYNVLSWYDYDKTAEDYENAEWFQIEFSFDGEEQLSISAMGTEHPENYKEFRYEFLQLISQMMLDAKHQYLDQDSPEV